MAHSNDGGSESSGDANSCDSFDALSDQFSDASEVLKAMASETRLKILCALSQGEKSVNQLAKATGQALPSVSQHLAKLRARELVLTRREAQTVYYRCSGGVGRLVVNALLKYYKS